MRNNSRKSEYLFSFTFNQTNQTVLFEMKSRTPLPKALSHTSDSAHRTKKSRVAAPSPHENQSHLVSLIPNSTSFPNTESSFESVNLSQRSFAIGIILS